MSSDDKQFYESPLTLNEALSRLAHEIREHRKVSAAQLAWFEKQDGDFSKLQLKRFSELKGSIESAITRAKEEIMATQAEAVAVLKEVRESQKKTISEIATLQTTVTELNQKIVVLEQAITNGDAQAELTDIVAEVKALALQADEQIPDVVVTPPPV